MFGNLGAPRLGAEGSGWSTCRFARLHGGSLGVTIWRAITSSRGSTGADFRRIAKLLRLGFPAAGQIGLETLVFATVTVLIGKLSAVFSPDIRSH